jgi:para-aminobenzoate synthetase component 1
MLPWQDPWSAACRLAERHGRDGLTWLDGDGTPMGRHAALGVAPQEVVECRGLPGEAGATDPFEALERLRRQGGLWMGWIGYEAGAWVEPGLGGWRTPAMATLWAGRYDPVLRFDLLGRRLWLEGSAGERFEAMAGLLQSTACGPAAPVLEPAAHEPIGLERWNWLTDPAAFAAGVERLRVLIAAGDLFQANLTACCETILPAAPDPLALYASLRRSCPAPFAGMAIAADDAVLSASPERFLQVSATGQVETRPIKGTRPRHENPERDADAAADLITSPKDRAENVMIVDLLRNDLGRVCVPGSIRVPQLVGLESYPQVHHLTSVVVGQLRPDCGVVELLRACWPGGSISGAPKLRACRRLNALELVPRGPYCGSLFRLEADGSFDSNILIRSVMVAGRRLRVHAGCGIVADSDPAGEAEELGWKLRPLLQALA